MPHRIDLDIKARQRGHVERRLACGLPPLEGRETCRQPLKKKAPQAALDNLEVAG